MGRGRGSGKWGALVEWPNNVGHESNNCADAAAAATTGDVTLAWSAFSALPRAREEIG